MIMHMGSVNFFNTSLKLKNVELKEYPPKMQLT